MGSTVTADSALLLLARWIWIEKVMQISPWLTCASASWGRLGAGKVNLVFGHGAICAIIDTAVSQESGLKLPGDVASEAAGCEIWIDDVTGSGDLLIGR